MTLKVSIIIPVYNTPVLYLQQAIKSIKHQTYELNKLEVCIHDDGSNKDYKNAYKDWIEKIEKMQLDFDIKISYGEKNNGPSYAKNRAASLCDGDLMIILDSDDILHKDAVRMCVNAFENNNKIELVYSDNIKFRYPSLELFQFRKKSYYQSYVKKHKGTVFDPVIQSSFVVGLQAFRRETFEYLGGFDTTLDVGEDVEFITRIHRLDEKNNFHHIPKVLYFRRHDDKSLSRRKQKEMWKKTERVFFNTAISMGLEVTDVRYFDRIAPYFVSHYLLMNEANILIPPYLDLTRKILIGCKDTVHTLRFEGTNIINNDLRPILDTKNERWYSNGK